MSEKQKTLKKEYTFEGKGLHSGLVTKMRIRPSGTGTGIRFLRSDIGPDAYIEALSDYVTYTQRGTTIEKGLVRISTAEHLLASFNGLGIDNAVVELDSFEVPILDGSALPYTKAFLSDGLDEQDAEREYYRINSEIVYEDKQSGSQIRVLPADSFSVELSIDFGSKVLGTQKAYYDENTDFASQIAPCKTFVFFHELEFLFKNNLIKGGDLENALVIVEKPVEEDELARMATLFNVERVARLDSGYLDNVKLHFDNECARHKLLDILGDFMLVGLRIKGKIIADKSGHKINTTMARIIREQITKNKR